MPRIRLATRRTIVKNTEELGLEGHAGPERQESQHGQEGQEGQGNPNDLQMPKRGSAELKAIIEALIFASPDPLTLKAIYKLLDSEPKEDVQAPIAEFKQDFGRP